MPRIRGVNKVQAWCEKHKAMTEHVEYLFHESPSKYVCILCKHDTPYAYSLYGRKPVESKVNKKVFNENHFGRQVA